MHHRNNDQVRDTATSHHDGTSVGSAKAGVPAIRALDDVEAASSLDGGFPRKTRGKPRASPGAGPVGLPLVQSLGLDQGPVQGPATGSGGGGAADWSLWWGTFRNIPGARLQVWRCSDTGLNLGEPILVMTVADAQQRRLDDEATAHAFLASRCGAGRYRFTPRSDQGAKIPGTHSLVTVIAEDTTMPSPTSNNAPTIAAPMDHDIAIEIERMRLAAEMEREREARRERQREQREERRRERDQDRERRRQEDRARRDDEERRRSERDAQTQTMLMQVLKEMAAGRSAASTDPLVAAALAKLGQPDPLVLKLLDSHGKREELTDFFKVQAESMRMASTLQTDSLKQVMTASQDVQSHLIRQAAEVASQRDGGEWGGIGSALSATANIIAALRGQAGARVVEPQIVPLPEVSATRTPMPALLTEISVPPLALANCLNGLRSMQQGKVPDNDDQLRRVVQRLPPSLLAAITRGDAQHLQTVLLPEIQRDAGLATWMSSPGVGEWLTECLGRAQRLVSLQPQSAHWPSATLEDPDAIV